mmetsp:Transcript_81837/g.128896  ORF Transcript_81837/g.128896 Transcript_81837/m.128896 type:complete len:156 (-) Transcript_81837:193-660(-)|eukprot:CAMPEP_0169093174 /NCGR_PEP_ID=MMETSP1015-20121227/17296_1 /TAXON_ID=342587 /ORGANISM="Karlodinium micrum, Strain CCMP2283" /LENGTH=155 /DNA_ID=CAMNT_0009153797 /DNA_START=47 /DNA_END=514 /DNA_ORIENTATION=+
MPQWWTRAQRDGFADFYGYEEDLETAGDDDMIMTLAPAVFLPDRDPVSPDRGGRERNDCMDNDWADAAEQSLVLVGKLIHEKTELLRSPDAGLDTARLQLEIGRLKLQQARLAKCLWCAEIDDGMEEAEGNSKQLKQALKTIDCCPRHLIGQVVA